ncbi:MAG: energy transducer TonB [Bacteroidetes bacterium]|nr:energy transducer TonB [Bacteroidota bacterium]
MKQQGIYSKGWCDQLFENKNKAYGAYELRTNAAARTVKGMLAAYGLIATAIIMAFAWQYFNPVTNVQDKFVSIPHIMEDIFIAPKEELATPKQEQAAAPAPAPKENLQPLIVADDSLNADDDDLAKLNLDDKSVNTSGSTGKGTDSLAIIDNSGGKGIDSTDVGNNTNHRVVQNMPEYPGGYEAMLQFIQSKVKYPRHLLEIGAEGTVYMSFVVRKDGTINGIEVLRGVAGAADFEKEAARLIGIMPKWKPGIQNGQSVNVIMNLPIAFKTK